MKQPRCIDCGHFLPFDTSDLPDRCDPCFEKRLLIFIQGTEEHREVFA